MFNIFRMHMYRVSKATSTWVMGIVLAAFMLLSLGLFIFIYNNPLTFMAEAISISMNGEGIRLYPSDTIYLFVQSNDALLILIAIFWLTLVFDGHHDSSRRRSTYHQPKYSYTGIRYRY